MKKPASPGGSSTRLSAVRKNSRETATLRSDAAYAKRRSSLLSEHTAPSTGPADSKRRLTGAFSIELSLIRPDPSQPRKTSDPAAQQELADSIKRIGLLQPITVRFIEAENAYRIIAGERRYQAARSAGLTEIPCWEQNPKEQDVLLHQIAENWQRADLHPFDIADALAQLAHTNDYTQQQLAEVTGKPKGEISKLLALLKLHPDVQAAARSDQSGTLTRRHLYHVSRLNQEQQQEFIDLIRKHGLTADETERLVKETKAKTTTPKKRGAPWTHHRYVTSHASVTVSFRTKNVTSEDIVAALTEVKRQIEQINTRPMSKNPRSSRKGA